MDVIEVQITIDALRPGMYVNRLDRDWVGTPFPLQGFYITKPEQIEQLRGFCQHVFVDSQREMTPAEVRRVKSDGALPARTRSYVNSHNFAQESPSARKVNEQAAAFAQQMITDVRAGQKLSAQSVQDAVEPMVQSILRNADAFLWISGMVRRDAYLYSHCVNCSALCAALGRHLGFPEDTLIQLATGGMLMDAGKVIVPDALLHAARRLSFKERDQVRRHVEYSTHVLDEAGIREDTIRDMVMGHHERIDGSGYPGNLSHSEIPLFARIAAVVDSYDAMTSHRPYSPAISRHAALQELYRGIGSLYQGEIVEQFLQCLGTYPTGSLVELSNGEVGIVIEQNQARRLRPRVMLLLDAEKRRYSRFPELDLLVHNEQHPEQPIHVVAAPEPGSYGLDPVELFLGGP
ncbi:MAG: metal-dependent phosphohydrolase [Lysobacterales bacterium CG17_big_fil_post_rev_8_21_14_2_50_64_11]|nr:MAG: metal-dependent phosphohydrolase [Xanthomonadales bacterium CG17_big_fil_post_rev_8_21_14_2_50_64_11]